MAADARDLLRSSDFGSSSEDEGVSNNNKHDNYEDSNATGLGQETAANLNSFEDSFNPNDSEVYAPVAARQAGFAKPRLPNTPAIIKTQGGSSSYASKNKVMKDAAGFMKENGPRGVFDRDDAVVQDLSRSRDDREDEHQDAYDISEMVKSGEPSFERSESQSRVLEQRNVNTLHTANSANSKKVKANGLNNKQPSTGVKQNLTLREQEKQLDDAKKEVFSLKLKIYFLEDRLRQTTPEHIEKALKDHIDLRVVYENTKEDLKKHKKIIQEQTRALEEVERNQNVASGRQSRAGMEAQAEIERLKRELEEERESNAQLKEERDDLAEQLEAAHTRASAKDADTENLENEIELLEKENADLRSQTNAQVTMLSAKNEEKEQLYEEIELLKQDIIGLEGELQNAQQEAEGRRNESPGETQALEDELNSYRDKLAGAMLDLDKRDKEIEELNNELDLREDEHQQELARVTDEWRVALEDVRRDKDQLTDALDDREQEIKELDRKLDEMDALAQEGHDKLEDALKAAQSKENEVEHLGEEVMGLTDDLQKLGKQIVDLEGELDEKNAKLNDLERELEAVDRELEDKEAIHSQVIIALKDKLGSSKSRHTELSIQHESLSTERKFLESKMEELALRCAELEEGKRTDERARARLEDDRQSLEKALRKKEDQLQEVELAKKRERAELENKYKGIIAERDQALSSLRNEVRQGQDRLQVREQDLERLNQALKARDSESRKAGEDHTSDKMSLILEVERLNRDLAHYEADLDHARSELDRKEDALRQHEGEAASLRANNNDIAAKLAIQTQTRLSLSEKLDETLNNLRDAQDELANAKDRMRHLQSQTGSDSRSTNRQAADYRDQLSERNALLQSVYQSIEKILGSERRKAGQSEIRPHSNFAVFHDTLTARLRSISQLQQIFDKRSRDIESRFTEQISSIKRQQDSRLKQLDRFESSIKSATEAQRQWKQKVMLKQGEVDAVKATNSELSNQITSLKTRVNVAHSSPGTSHKMQTLAARASAAEKRLTATQAHLQAVEEKFAEAKDKAATAEDQWAARLKEMLERQRKLEEKLKRERQGAKERVRDLEQNVIEYKQQIQDANARSKKLSTVLNREVDHDPDETVRR